MTALQSDELAGERAAPAIGRALLNQRSVSDGSSTSARESKPVTLHNFGRGVRATTREKLTLPLGLTPYVHICKA